ncbi:hypothetical protein MWN52_13600 [Pseudoxanthomonas winnipegensis]|nr:hypothetical protein [Pseudoxanthomonas winnipegensis]WJI14655.1 hypothetical protein MWN52_13600 [Pseudoxanthomonas winnipegensis]
MEVTKDLFVDHSAHLLDLGSAIDVAIQDTRFDREAASIHAARGGEQIGICLNVFSAGSNVVAHLNSEPVAVNQPFGDIQNQVPLRA